MKGKVLFAAATLAMVFSLAGCSTPRGSQSAPGSNSVLSSSSVLTSEASVAQPAIILSVEGGELDQETKTIRMLVDKETDRVPLSSKVSVSEGCTWKLYRGEEELPTRVATTEDGVLVDGNNSFSIVVTASDGLERNIYELIIYRSFLITISYNFKNNIIDTEEAPTGYEWVLKDCADITGYSFQHWTYQDEAVVSIIPWDNLSVVAKATPNCYLVTLDSNGGEAETSTVCLTFDSPYELPIPSKTGYEFLGWFYGDRKILTEGEWAISSDVTLLAKWEIITYTISYDLKGGTNHPLNPTSYTVEDELKVYDPARQGYFFTGWLDDEGEQISFPLQTVLARNLTLTATWCIDSLEFQEISGGLEVVSLKSQAQIDILEIPAKYEGKDVISIGQKAFMGCSSLKSVVIPDSVVSIGSRSFYGCSSLKSVAIPDSVALISSQAFYSCSSLTSIVLPNSLDELGPSVFGACGSLVFVVIPDSVTSLGEFVFSSCRSLASIDIPDSVVSIGKCAFSLCTSLRSVVLPDSVVSVGERAFSNCESLASIEISSSVTSLGSDVFEGCGALSSITVHSDNPVFDSRDECNAIIDSGSGALIVGCKNTIIPASVTSIAAYAFHGCSSLKSIVIPDSVVSIGYWAFSGCSSLESITLSNSLTSISGSAFVCCYSLTSIVVPSSVVSVGKEAFSDCPSLMVYCEAASRPSGWAGSWYYKIKEVVWGWHNPAEDTTSFALHILFYEKYVDQSVQNNFKNALESYLNANGIGIVDLTYNALTPSANGTTFATDLETFEKTSDYAIDVILGAASDLGSYVTQRFDLSPANGVLFSYSMAGRDDRFLWVRKDTLNQPSVSVLKLFLKSPEWVS